MNDTGISKALRRKFGGGTLSAVAATDTIWLLSHSISTSTSGGALVIGNKRGGQFRDGGFGPTVVGGVHKLYRVDQLPRAIEKEGLIKDFLDLRPYCCGAGLDATNNGQAVRPFAQRLKPSLTGRGYTDVVVTGFLGNLVAGYSEFVAPGTLVLGADAVAGVGWASRCRASPTRRTRSTTRAVSERPRSRVSGTVCGVGCGVGQGPAIAATPHPAPAANSRRPMSDYELHYWQMPFRGQFIRAILAFAGQRWDEFDDDAVSTLMEAVPAAQPVPFMGPPMLVDRHAGVALAEMPAIAYYLGETLDLMPASVAGKALALKVVNDANDVIDELTLDGGKQMWSPQRWKKFQPRLAHWMSIWEETGRRHGLARDAGFLLGGPRAGVTDIITATLWGTLDDHFPVIGHLLETQAPATAALAKRVNAEPSMVNLAAVTRERFGDSYCGGEIEKSMKRVIR